MNIVFLSRLFYPHIGGVEIHVEKLSRELIKSGHTVSVITSQFESSLNLEETHAGISVIRIPKTQALGKRGVWSWMGEHRQLFHQADIIHAHDVFWWYLPLRFRTRQPIFTTFHGWEGTFPPTFKAKCWRRLAQRLSAGNICVGDYIRSWYGTQPDAVTYGASDQLQLPPGNARHLLVLGRIDADNDLDIVIEALKLLQPDFPKLRVDFLGNGDLAFQAAQVGNVLGFHADLSKYLATAGCIIASSYLSILDALAAGRKVFSVYSNPLKKEYLTGHPAAAALSICYTPKELAAVIAGQLINQPPPSPQQLQAEAWARAQTWEKLSRLYLELWQKP